MTRNLLIVILMGINISCSDVDRKELKYALSLAGENRVELQKVLDHYSAREEDSLKLRAAEYLIRHMPLQYSLSAEVFEFYDSVSVFLDHERDQQRIIEMIESLSSQYTDRVRLEPDINHITGQFLIANIESSFRMWREGNWARHLSFAEFCEYLLPYKCNPKQPLSLWKDTETDYYKGDLDTLFLCAEYRYNPRGAVISVNRHLREQTGYNLYYDLNSINIFDARTIVKMPMGRCDDYTFAAVVLMRSKGIPVAIDYTPQWADRRHGHTWSVVLNNRHQNAMFSPFNTSPNNPHHPNNPLAKVFRMTYTPNKELFAILGRDRFLPQPLNNIFMKDISMEYMRTDDITVEESIPNNLSGTPYICVFNNFEWRPVYWGEKAGRGKIKYRDLGRGVVYLPVKYDNGVQVPVGDPFLLSLDGSVQKLIMDTTTRRDIYLERKYPLFVHVYLQRHNLKKGIIEASDNSGFANAERIVEFPEITITSGKEFISPKKPYRYWRFRSSTDGRCDMAEMYFFEKGTGERLHPTVFEYGDDAPGGLPNHGELVTDGNALTYFQASGDARWVGFDFGKPVDICQISYIRRGDGNAIVPGNEYELYYWGGKGWEFVGRQTAQDVSLEFTNVPGEALFYIKCPTEGTNQRIFLYRNGEPVWY